MDKKFGMKNAILFLLAVTHEYYFLKQTFVHIRQTRKIIGVGNSTKSENAQCKYTMNCENCIFA